MDPLRLANIIKLSTLSVNQIWEIAKEVKLEASLDLGCKTFGLYEDHEKRFQVEAFEKRINVKSSEQAFTNITKEDITGHNSNIETMVCILQGIIPNPVTRPDYVDIE